jgi:geranylgeranyl pyrophosphate synthase
MMIEQFIVICQQRANRVLAHALPSILETPNTLHQALHYAVLNGGKRIRPTLVYTAGEALGIGWHKLDAAACAIELIHAYSLVHDDLPAMDNDTYRRGQLTCHKAFDEATAILVGDALQSLAFEVISRESLLNAEQRIRMIRVLAKAAGSQGMAGGQALDLSAINQTVTFEQLETIHQLKTGALLRACVELATIAHETDPNVVEILLEYAELLGLAFQIKDDVLDYQQAYAIKPELSYALAFSVQQAEQKLVELHQQALNLLARVNLQQTNLAHLMYYVVNRAN